MNSKYNDLFDKIESLDDLQMLQIIVDAQHELNKEFFPQITIVSNSSAKKEIIGILSALIGSANVVLDDLENAENDYIVRIQYGTDWNKKEFDDSESSTNVVNIYVPWDVLKSLNILWICSSSLESIPNSLVINSDKVILVTNATMAMTQEEKCFLTNARKSILNDEPITISLCNKLSMNTGGC